MDPTVIFTHQDLYLQKQTCEKVSNVTCAFAPSQNGGSFAYYPWVMLSYDKIFNLKTGKTTELEVGKEIKCESMHLTNKYIVICELSKIIVLVLKTNLNQSDEVEVSDKFVHSPGYIKSSMLCGESTLAVLNGRELLIFKIDTFGKFENSS